MKISTKYMVGVIVVILVVTLVYLSIESVPWFGGTKIYIAVFTALLIGSSIGYYVSRSLSKNFNELRVTAEKISNGDFTQKAKIPLDVYFADETADIAESINLMLNNLRDFALHITDTSLKVLQSSLNLYKLSDQINDSTNDISESFNYVNKGAAKQLSMISQMLKTINDMTVSSETIAQYSKEAEAFEKQSTFNAQRGGKVVKDTLTKLKGVFEKVEGTADLVLKFGEITGSIRTIVQVITSIAKQTNILALNASIEASKAGEAGKGFSSVVADIKIMSEDSKNAATQISELLKEIELKSDKTVHSMKEVSNEIIEGRAMLEITNSTLERIVSLVAEAEMKMSKISMLTDSHVNKTKEIAEGIKDIALLAEENKSATENIASASDDQRLSIEEMAESAQQMHNLSEELKNITSKFKLDERKPQIFNQ